MIALVLGVAASAGLSGCVGPIAVVRQSANAIELRWMNSENSFDEAKLVAQDHCGGPAFLDSEFLDRDVTLAKFGCAPGSVPAEAER
jgi:hypothetical protein